MEIFNKTIIISIVLLICVDSAKLENCSHHNDLKSYEEISKNGSTYIKMYFQHGEIKQSIVLGPIPEIGTLSQKEGNETYTFFKLADGNFNISYSCLDNSTPHDTLWILNKDKRMSFDQTIAVNGNATIHTAINNGGVALQLQDDILPIIYSNLLAAIVFTFVI